MMDSQHPTPVNERYLKRFPQAARVSDLIGLPVLDLERFHAQVSYSRWWGWFGRPIAVTLEALGVKGRQLVSLDMPPSECATAPTWHDAGDMSLSADEAVRVALARI